MSQHRAGAASDEALRSQLYDKALLPWLVKTTPGLPEDFFQHKEDLAKGILAMHRAAILQKQAGMVRIAGADAEETRAYVEERYVEDDVESILAHTLAKEMSYERLLELSERDGLPTQDDGLLQGPDYGLEAVFRGFAQQCQSDYRLRARRF